MSASEKQLIHLHKINDGRGMRGKKHSIKTRLKMSRSNHRLKIWLGKKFSEETKRKISIAGKKRVLEGRHNNYKGGISSLNIKIRNSFEYGLWRSAVFARDNYICIWCYSNKNIEADHIQEFSKFPELRFAIDNGRTLCRECHYKRHNKTICKKF